MADAPWLMPIERATETEYAVPGYTNVEMGVRVKCNENRKEKRTDSIVMGNIVMCNESFSASIGTCSVTSHFARA